MKNYLKIIDTFIYIIILIIRKKYFLNINLKNKQNSIKQYKILIKNY